MTDAKQIKHVYDYEVLVEADTAPARVVRMVGKEKVVLEVGSGPGSITKILTAQNKCRVTALEVDPVAASIVKDHCEKVIAADLNDPAWPRNFQDHRFDRVVAADVLEHVYKPLEVLIGMKSLLNANGEIVVSLPHIGHAGIATCVLSADFTYRDWGLLDRTHIRFFGLKNIDELFQSAGLSILEVQFVVRHPLETEFAQMWMKLGASVQKAILGSKSTYVYQVVVRAAPAERVQKSIEVASTSIPTPRTSFKTVLKQLIPASFKKTLKRIVGRA